jgi:hypothetical protein
MQAVTVLLLELAQGTSHAEPAHIIACVGKLTQWLRTMSQVDIVADRAYGIVCRMLNKKKQDVGDAAASQWPEGTIHPSALESNLSSDMAPQPYDPNLDYYQPQESVWPMEHFDQRRFTQANAGPFDMSNFANPLRDGYANAEFQQDPLPFYYGNLFSTYFDETMEFEQGGNTDQDEWTTPDQQPPQ